MQFSIHFIWKAKRVFFLNGMALHILPKTYSLCISNVEKWMVFHLKLLIWRKIMHAFIVVLLYASWFCIMLSINVHLFTAKIPSIHPNAKLFHATKWQTDINFPGCTQLTQTADNQKKNLRWKRTKKAQRMKNKMKFIFIKWKYLLWDAKGNLLQKI